MAFQSVGTPVSQRNTFNSGLITIGTDQLVDVADITIDESFTEKSFRSLNSIFKRNLKRAEYEASISFTTMTEASALVEYFYSSESTVSASEIDYTIKDGQQSAIDTFLLTLYSNDAGTQGTQYELENATILTINKAPSSQEFTQYSVTVACTKISSIKRITA